MDDWRVVSGLHDPYRQMFLRGRSIFEVRGTGLGATTYRITKP